jgi:hypothetical protein
VTQYAQGTVYFLLEELALLQTELSAGFTEKLEQFPQAKQVLLKCAANYDHTIQVHET